MHKRKISVTLTLTSNFDTAIDVPDDQDEKEYIDFMVQHMVHSKEYVNVKTEWKYADNE